MNLYTIKRNTQAYFILFRRVLYNDSLVNVKDINHVALMGQRFTSYKPSYRDMKVKQIKTVECFAAQRT